MKACAFRFQRTCFRMFLWNSISPSRVSSKDWHEFEKNAFLKKLKKLSNDSQQNVIFFSCPSQGAFYLPKWPEIFFELFIFHFLQPHVEYCFHHSLVRAFWSRTSQTIWPVGAGAVRVIISSSVKLSHCLELYFPWHCPASRRFFNNLRSRAPHMHLSTIFGHSAAGWRHSGAWVDRQDFSSPWGELWRRNFRRPSRLWRSSRHRPRHRLSKRCAPARSNPLTSCFP